MLFDVVYTLYTCTIKFTSIAEPQPILCKDTAFKWNAHLKVYQKWFWFRSYCVLLREA